MIRRVEFRNFKGLREVDLDLERLTVLVGPNASGKTSVLEGIYYLTQRGDNRSPWGLSSQELIEQYKTRGSDSPLSLNAVVKQTRDSNTENDYYFESSDNQPGNHGLPGNKAILGLAEFLRLDVRKLAEPSVVDLGPASYSVIDGTGLASKLADLILDDPAEFEKLQERLEGLIPSVKKVRIRRVIVNHHGEDGQRVSHPGEELRIDTISAKDLPASMISEGTLLVLGILTFFMKPNPPQIFLIDDIDRGLHPRAQRDLINTLRAFLNKNPNLQIIATSHSPYLLDCLDPSEVRLTTLLEDGSTACARLDEHPEFAKWKDEMAPGEMWSLFGEKWVADLRAKEPVE